MAGRSSSYSRPEIIYVSSVVSGEYGFRWRCYVGCLFTSRIESGIDLFPLLLNQVRCFSLLVSEGQSHMTLDGTSNTGTVCVVWWNAFHFFAAAFCLKTLFLCLTQWQPVKRIFKNKNVFVESFNTSYAQSFARQHIYAMYLHGTR